MTLSHDLLRAALEGLEAAKTRIEGQIESVRASLGIKRRGRPPKSASAQAPPKRKRRKMSAAARKKIGDATRKRWAALRKAKGQ
jgi:hypothetical protein